MIELDRRPDPAPMTSGVTPVREPLEKMTILDGSAIMRGFGISGFLFTDTCWSRAGPCRKPDASRPLETPGTKGSSRNRPCFGSRAGLVRQAADRATGDD